MKIKSGFMLRQLGTQYVAVPIGLRNNEFKGMIKLNETASKIWEFLAAEEHTEEELVAYLMSQFAIDEQLAKEEATGFIQIVQLNGLLEDAS